MCGFQPLLLVLLLLLWEPTGTNAQPASTDRPLCKPGVAQPPNRFNSSERVAALRRHLQLNESTFFLQTSIDNFLSPPEPHDQLLVWLTGFFGSAGDVLVSGSKAMLFTDSRYTVQADQELDCDWVLYDNSKFSSWLSSGKGHVTLLVDQRQVSQRLWLQLQQMPHVKLVALAENPIDKLWTEQRPQAVQREIYPLPARYFGRDWPLKVQMVREAANASGAHCVAVTALDETAYLLNLRGTVVVYKPYFASRVIVCQRHLLVFVEDPELFSTNQTLRAHFSNCRSGPCPEFVRLADYSSKVASLGKVKVMADLSAASAADVAPFTASGSEVHDAMTPVKPMKALKDNKERQEFADCSLLDSAALVAFLHDLHKRMANGEQMTELSAGALLRKYRASIADFRGLSFEPIAASGPNAAIVHYRPVASTDRRLTDTEAFLLDSGGQYLGCTTDITRTLYFGASPPAEVRTAYTRVLAGLIDLSDLTWPASVTALRFDAFARHNLWQAGQNYGHGTGHGIGQFLSVHEGPNGIGANMPLQEGHFQSIEPGFYQREAPNTRGFGIRLEIISGLREASIKGFDGSTYLRFSPVSWVPFEPKLIDERMLSPKQLSWLRWYNSECERRLRPMLDRLGHSEAMRWVEEKTVTFKSAAALRAQPAAAAFAAAAVAVAALVMRN